MKILICDAQLRLFIKVNPSWLCFLAFSSAVLLNVKRKRKRVCLQSEIPIEFSRLYNLRPWYWNSFLYSLISSGENSAFAHFAAAIANHYNLAFSFHQVPITAGWTEAAWYERLAQRLYTWLVMCYHCVRVAVGPHCHVCSTRRQA